MRNGLTGALPWRQLSATALVLLAGVALSVIGSMQLLDFARARELRALEEQAASKAEQVQLAINRALESLGSIRAFHDAHGSFSADSFSRFVKSDAAFHPGTLALGWVPRVTLAERAAFERQLQPVAGRTASIFEVNWHGLLVESPAREDYFPVQYLVSLTDGELVQGMNLAAMSWLQRPLQESIESGGTAVVVRPRTTVGRPNAFLIQAFTPVFRGADGGAASTDRARVAGLAMGVFDISSFFASVFNPATEPYQVAVFALDRHGQARAVFAPGPEAASKSMEDLRASSRRVWEREFHVADQIWRAVFIPRETGTQAYWLPYAGLAAGIAITTLLAAYLYLAQWRTAQVLQLSRSLRDTERRLFDERVTAAVQSQLREQAQASEIAKTHLLQAASHDLRQPMHALGLYLGHASAEAQSGLSVSRWLPAMQQSFDSLHGMFDALLDWSRLESGRLRPQLGEVDVAPIVERLGHEYAEQARLKGLEFTVQTVPANVVTDAVLLERVLRNLLSNALRYTASGSVILSARRRRNALCVRVADTGPGIEPSSRERLFAAFERGIGARQRHDGLGLGLAIASQTAALLGHALRVRSSVGRGSIFSITMTCADAAAPLVLPVSARATDCISGCRILVVDDDTEMLTQTVGLLERWGAVVSGASTFRDAERRLRETRFDCVIADQYLGDGTGLDLGAGLSAAAQPPAVVLLSGDLAFVESMRATRPELMVLAKPLAPLRLRSVLHYLLAVRTPDSGPAVTASAETVATG